MKKLIVISDYDSQSVEQCEIRSAIEGNLREPYNPNISFVQSSSNSIQVAFILSQLIETEERFGRPLDTVFFVGVDPRSKHEAEISHQLRHGADFYILRLKSGMYVCGPNAEYTFSFLNKKIHQLYLYKNFGENNSRFRSRDNFSKIVAYLMDSLQDDMELQDIHTTMIPVLTSHYIGDINNFGTLKTTLTKERMKGKYMFEDVVSFQIGGKKVNAKYLDSLFLSTPGEIVVFPSSNGHADNPYLSIGIWRNFAAERENYNKFHPNLQLLSQIQVGDEIII